MHVVSAAPLVVHVGSPALAASPPPAATPASPAAAAAAPASVRPGLLDLVRDDASDRALEGLARRGPARLLAFGVAALATLGALGSLAAWSTIGALALAWLVPCGVTAVVAFVVGLRTERGVIRHPLEPAALRYAFAHGGVVRIGQLAHETGRSLRECQAGLDALVSAGHATLDSDEQGGLMYRIPDAHAEANRLENPRVAALRLEDRDR